MNSSNFSRLKSIIPLVILLLIPLVMLHGCTIKRTLPPPKRPPVPSYPAPPVPQEPVKIYSPRLGPAAALYQKAETHIMKGRYREAELSLERALRIEPRNGHYWHTMAKVKYHQNQHNQAIQFCLKSKSLAGRDRQLIRLNDNLIYNARQRLGQ